MNILLKFGLAFLTVCVCQDIMFTPAGPNPGYGVYKGTLVTLYHPRAVRFCRTEDGVTDPGCNTRSNTGCNTGNIDSCGNSTSLVIMTNRTIRAQACYDSGASVVNTAKYYILPAVILSFVPPSGQYGAGTVISVTTLGADRACLSAEGTTPVCGNSGRCVVGDSTYTLTSGVTVLAQACSDAGNSDIARAVYTLAPARLPRFSIGLVADGTWIQFTSDNADHLCWTADQTTPVCSLNGCVTGMYVSGNTGSYLVTVAVSLLVQGCSPGGDSDVQIYNYDLIPPDTPTFNLPSGMVSQNASVTFTSINATRLCYTTNGVVPDCSLIWSTCTSVPGNTATVVLSSRSTTIQVIGCSNGGSSMVGVARYMAVPALLPVFSPPPGRIVVGSSVVITSVNSSYICYTTDGTDPACSDSFGCLPGNFAYSGVTLSFTNAVTIKAQGCSIGGNSDTTTGCYSIAPAITPVFSQSGVAVCGSNVLITSTNSSHICYTQDSTDPVCSDTGCAFGTFGSALSLSGSGSVRAQGCSVGGHSPISGTSYSILNAASPMFTPGAVPLNQLVGITSPSASYICYSIDGTAPQCGNAGTCAGGIRAVGNMTTVPIPTERFIRAVGCSPGGSSSINQAGYTIMPAGIPSYSPAGAEVQFGTTVTITSLNSRSVCYTTGSTVPLDPLCSDSGCSSGKPGNTISITSPMVIVKAQGCLNGGRNSPISLAYYVVAPASFPVFSPSFSSVSCGTPVTVTSLNAQRICYTTDGLTLPVCARNGASCTTGREASGSSLTLSVSNSIVLLAQGCSIGGNSDVAQASYLATAANTLSASIVTGQVPFGTVVTFSALSSCQICYSQTNATAQCSDTGCQQGVPVQGSTASVTLLSPQTITVQACSSGGHSAVLTNTYTIAPAQPPVFSSNQLVGCSAPVTITSVNAQRICYTTDGTAPICSSTSCSSGASATGSSVTITLAAARTVQAQGCSVGGHSSVTSSSYSFVASPSPSFSVTSGVVPVSTVVSVTSTGSCRICYTTDGSSPTCSDQSCQSGIAALGSSVTLSISNPVTVRARGCYVGGSTDINQASYTIASAQTPSFSPNNQLSCGTGVVIASSNARHICYSVDGVTLPSCSSTGCVTGIALAGSVGTVTVSSFLTIQAQGCSVGGNSGVAQAQLSLLSARDPIFSIPSSQVVTGTQVSVTSPNSCRICYTMDGTCPICQANGCAAGNSIAAGSSVLISINAPGTIKAVGCSPGGDSAISMASYTILSARMPTFTAGAVAQLTRVSITSTNACRICYTDDLTNPTCSSTDCVSGNLRSVGPLALYNALSTTPSNNLRAQGCSPSGSSDSLRYDYVLITPDTPIFNPQIGEVPYASRVVITSINATYLCYTTDGTVPQCGAGNTANTCFVGLRINSAVGTVAITRSTVRLGAVGCALTASSAYALTMFRVLPAKTPTFLPTNSFVPYGTVVIMNSENSTTLCYTTDGSTPLCSTDGTTCDSGTSGYSTVLMANTVVRAQGCSPAGNSDSSFMSYIIGPAVTPTFSPAGGNVNSRSIITISSINSSYICYSLDGVAPACGDIGCLQGSQGRTFVVPMVSSFQVIAQGCSPGGNSQFGSANYVVNPALTPYYTPGAVGFQGASVAVTSVSARQICYGLDPTTPICTDSGCSSGQISQSSSLSYSVQGTVLIRAQGCSPGGSTAVAQQGYTVHVAGTPYFTPLAGEVRLGTMISIATTSTGTRHICYTETGADPSCLSSSCAVGSMYTGSFALQGPRTIKAIGCGPGGNSRIGSAFYTLPTARMPIFTPGWVAEGAFVTLTSTNADHLCYTTGSTLPQCANVGCLSGALLSGWSGGFTVSSPINITVQGCSYGGHSSITRYSYTILPPDTPTFSLISGAVSLTASVSFTSINATRLCYTINGGVPSCDSNNGCNSVAGNTGAVSLGRNVTWIRVIGCSSGGSSRVAAARYTLVPAEIPVFRPAPGFVAYGTIITITSVNSSFICVTEDGSEPQCGESDCRVGTFSQNTGSSIVMTRNLRARGCSLGGNSASSSATYRVAPAEIPWFFPPSGMRVMGTVVLATSVNATHLCVSDDGSVDPQCTDTGCSVGVKTDTIILDRAKNPKAMGCSPGGHSMPQWAVYVIAPAQLPVISPRGLVNCGTPISITSQFANIICYSTDVNNPPRCSTSGSSCTSGALFTSLVVNVPTTVIAQGCTIGGNSNNTVATYTVRPATDPSFTIGLIGYSRPIVIRSTSASHICYTVDGTTPVCGSSTCSFGTRIAGSVASVTLTSLSDIRTLRAQGCSPGGFSTVTQATYRLLPAGTPSYVPAGAEVAFGTTVTMTAIDSRFICYTTGTTMPADPQCSEQGCVVGKPGNTLTILSTYLLVKAIGCLTEGRHSTISLAYYVVIPAEAPTFSPGFGAQICGTPLTISSQNSQIICYSTDGTIPSCASTGTRCNSGTTAQGPSVTFTPSGNPVVMAQGCSVGGNSNVTQTNYNTVVAQMPSISLASGSVALGTTLAISSTGSCRMCVTTDCTLPVCSISGCSWGSSVTSPGQLTINTNMTVTVQGCSPGGDSDYAMATYTIAPAQTPVFNPPSGAVTGCSSQISITSVNAQRICFTADGTVPACSSTGCSFGTLIAGGFGFVSIASARTIRAVGCSSGGNSQGSISSFTIASPTDPTFSVQPGIVPIGTTVLVGSSGACRICYTTDSTTPACTSTGCTGIMSSSGSVLVPITVPTTIKAQACYVSGQSSLVQATYTIAAAQVPIFFGSSSLSCGSTITVSSVNARHICYTTTGTNPICSNLGCLVGTQSASLTVLNITSPQTILAQGCSIGGHSAVGQSTFSIQGAFDPTLTPPSSEVASGTTVNIFSQSACRICVTIDGTVPACSDSGCIASTLYPGTFASVVITSSRTIQAIGCAPGGNTRVSRGVYTIRAALIPVFTSGALPQQSIISISSPNACRICYTDDGTMPSCTSDDCATGNQRTYGPLVLYTVLNTVTANSLRAQGCSSGGNSVVTGYDYGVIAPDTPTFRPQIDLIGYGSPVTIRSINATYLCVTTDGTVPQCVSSGSGCSLGSTLLPGNTGSINIMFDTKVGAVGCTSAASSAFALTRFRLAPAQTPTYNPPSSAVPSLTNVIISSVNSVWICYTDDCTPAVCSSTGCLRGTRSNTVPIIFGKSVNAQGCSPGGNSDNSIASYTVLNALWPWLTPGNLAPGSTVGIMADNVARICRTEDSTIPQCGDSSCATGLGSTGISTVANLASYTLFRAQGCSPQGPSTVNTAGYNLSPAGTPFFLPLPGDYAPGTVVSIFNSTISTRHICFTDLAVDPVCTSNGCAVGSQYTGPITLQSQKLFRAIGCGIGGNSRIGHALYTIPIANDPIFMAGFVADGAAITVTSLNADHLCVSTTDIPVCSSSDCVVGSSFGGNTATYIVTGLVTYFVQGCSLGGNSRVSRYTYDLLPPDTPTFAGGLPTSSQVTITSINATRVCYSIDAFYTPDCTNDLRNTCGLGRTVTLTLPNVNASVLVWAIGCSNGGSSRVSSAQYFYSPAITPVFTPGSGVVAAGSLVTITSINSSFICYTDDGSDPQCDISLCAWGRRVLSGFNYPIITSLTLKAQGCSPGGHSLISSSCYAVAPAVTPTFSTGTAGCGSVVSITSINSSFVCYTTDATEPLCGATTCLYGFQGNFLTLTGNTLVTARGCSVGGNSNTSSTSYTIRGASIPAFTPGSLAYSQNTTITSLNAAYICYTVDGSAPACGNNNVCSNGATAIGSSVNVVVQNERLLRAQGCSAGGFSTLNQVSYTILRAGTPFFNPPGDLVWFRTPIIIGSRYASHICYTFGTSVPADPQCTDTGCSFGSLGTTLNAVATFQAVKARGCLMGGRHSPVALAYYNTYPAYTPVFTPTTQNLFCGAQVTISSINAQRICYTLDGSIPVCGNTNTACKAGIIVNTNFTSFSLNTSAGVTAIGCSTFVGNSEISYINYTVSQASPPTFVPPSGVVPWGTQVLIGSAGACGACFTLDSTVPVCNNQTCSVGTLASPDSPIIVTSPMTVTVQACSTGGHSAIRTAVYTIAPALLPVFTPGPGVILGCNTAITITSINAQRLCFSTDGTVPACSAVGCTAGQFASGSTTTVTVTDARNLQAQGCSIGGDSPISTSSYTIVTPIAPFFTVLDFMLSTGTIITVNSGNACRLCYTINGATPSCSSTGCSVGTLSSTSVSIPVVTNITVQAIGCYPIANIAAIQRSYIVSPAAPPTFTSTGTVSCATPISISSINASAICYTLNGTTPSCGSATSCLVGTLALGSQTVVPITETRTVMAQGCSNGGYSVVRSATYNTFGPTTPIFTPSLSNAAMEVPTGTVVSIASPNACHICYTIDGTCPVCSRNGCNVGLYRLGAVTSHTITTAITLKAIGCTTDAISDISQASYTIVAAGIPIFTAGLIAQYTPVTVTATNACRVCYTDDLSTPSCSLGTCSANSNRSEGWNAMYPAVAWTRRTTLRAQGCSTAGSSTVYRYDYELLAPDTPLYSPQIGDVRYGTVITITSVNATYLCVSTQNTFVFNGAYPVAACNSLTGGCLSGRYIPGSVGTVTVFDNQLAVGAVGCALDASSPYAQTEYTIPVAKLPTFFPTSRCVGFGSFVGVSSDNSTIVCTTTDGTDPQCSSIGDSCTVGRALNFISITSNTTIKAVGCSLAGSSSITSSSYCILPPVLPTYSPPSGAVASQTVVLITSINSSYICYTLDGTSPMCSQDGCSSGTQGRTVQLVGVVTINAMGCSPGGRSGVSSATYTVIPAVTPVFTWGSTWFPTVSINAPLANRICYSTDGSVASCTDQGCSSGAVSSNGASASFFLNSASLVQAQACSFGGNSLTAWAGFTVQASGTPFFVPLAGLVPLGTAVTISSTFPATRYICFSTSGQIPVCGNSLSTTCQSGSAYSSPIIIGAPTTILARGCGIGVPSQLAVATYTIPVAQMPIFSPGFVADGTAVTVSSMNADHLCVAIQGSPRCSILGCFVGNFIDGPTATWIVTNPITYTVQGCSPGGHSDFAQYRYSILPPDTPTFNLVSGVVGYSSIVTFTSINATRLCYTVNGAVPSCNAWDTCISVAGNTGSTALPTTYTIIQAIGCSSGGSSPVGVGRYTLGAAQTPVFVPSGGSFSCGTPVSVTSSTSGYMCYTDDGTTPACGPNGNGCLVGNVVGQVIISSPLLRAVGCSFGGNSAVSQASFNIPPALTPVFSPSSGIRAIGSLVTISAINSSYICYTDDGTDPVCWNGDCVQGKWYSPFPVRGPGVIKAQACSCSPNGHSGIVFVTYSVAPAQLPVFQPSSGGVTCSSPIRITSTDAERVCYSTNPAVPPACSSTGCSAGTNGFFVPISSNTTVWAQGCSAGGNSAITSASYTILPAGIPNFTPGSVGLGRTVTISSDFASYICYTTDGSSAICGSNDGCFAGQRGLGNLVTVTVSNERLLRAQGCSPGGNSSPNQAGYTILPAGTPSFSPIAGLAPFGSTITMTSTNSRGICYTVGSTMPQDPVCGVDSGCAVGVSGNTFVINSANVIIRARGCQSGNRNSLVSTACFGMSPALPPVFNVNATCGGALSIVSSNAQVICYSVDGVTIPMCSPAGTGCMPGSLQFSGDRFTFVPQGTPTVMAVGCSAGGPSSLTWTTYSLPIASRPTFTVSPGAVPFGTEVSVQSLFSCSVCYTLDCSTPVCSSNGRCLVGTSSLDTIPRVSVTNNITITAQGCSWGGHSTVISGLFYVAPARTPGFVSANSCDTGVVVTSLNAQRICYTTNSTQPSCSSTSSTGCSVGFSVTGSVATINYEGSTNIVQAQGCSIAGNSAVSSSVNAYSIPSAILPVYSVVSGPVGFGTVVSITSAFSCRICVTSDNTDPVCSNTGCTNGNSTQSGVSYSIIRSITFRSQACWPNGRSSISTASYTIEPARDPLFAASANQCGTVVTVTSLFAQFICTTIDNSGSPSCGTDSCSAGTFTRGGIASVTLGSARSVTAIGCSVGGNSAQRTSTWAWINPTNPVFSPPSSQVPYGTVVVFTSASACRVCYTSDGTIPSCSSNGCNTGIQYTNGYQVTSAVTLRAIGCTGVANTSVISASYTIRPAEIPIFTPGAIAQSSIVTISSPNACRVCYTDDRTAPACYLNDCPRGTRGPGAGTDYLALVTVSQLSLRAQGCSPGGDSTVYGYDYTLLPPDTPTFNPPLGSVRFGSGVTVSSINASYICYTVDDTIPVCGSTGAGCFRGAYISGSQGPISVTSPFRILAVGCAQTLSSGVSSACYTIAPAQIPTFNPPSGIYQAQTRITMTSINSTHICYSDDCSLPLCGIGSCIRGTMGNWFTLNLGKRVTAQGCSPGGHSGYGFASFGINQAIFPTFTFGAVPPGPNGVTIVSSNVDRICRTEDSSIPACGDSSCRAGLASQGATAALNVQSTVLYRALGCSTAGASPLVAAGYTVHVAGTPYFTPLAGDVSPGTLVTIASASPGTRHICYTENGQEPVCTSTSCQVGSVYSSVVSITVSPRLLRARACGIGGNSMVGHALYTIPAAQAVTFSPFGGYLEPNKFITIYGPSADHICYSIDGTVPACSLTSCSSGTYSDGISATVSLPDSRTVWAVGCSQGGSSPLASASYILTTCSLGSAPPTFSPDGGNILFGQTVLLSSASSDFICSTVDGRDPVCLNNTCLVGNQGTFITIVATTTVRARGCSSRGHSRLTVSNMYTLQGAGIPSFNPSAGVLTSGQTISVTSSGASHICYSMSASPLCGTVGCLSGTLVQGNTLNLVITVSTSLRAQGCLTTGGHSSIIQVQYTVPTSPFSTNSDSLIGTDNVGITEDDTPPADGAPVNIPTKSAGPIVPVPTAASPTQPLFLPDGGPTVFGTLVAISSSNSEHICITTDNSDPLCDGKGCRVGSVPNTQGVVITTSTLLKARGCTPDNVQSSIGQAYFTVVSADLPTFSPASGVIKAGTDVKISSADAIGMCYTVNGADPACSGISAACISGSKWVSGSSATITVTESSTIAVMGCRKGGNSVISRSTYTIALPSPDTPPTTNQTQPETPSPSPETPELEPPTFIPANGQVAPGSSVTMKSANANHICYTTNNLDPICTVEGCWVGIIAGYATISTSTLVKAVACQGTKQSAVSQSVYSISTAASPVFSPNPGSVSVGSKITVSSALAEGLCVAFYTNSATATPAACSTEKRGECVTGSWVEGDVTTFTILAKVVVYVQGCLKGGNSEVGQASYTLLGGKAVAQTPTFVAKDKTLTITSSQAQWLCISTIKSNAACADVGCSSGTFVPGSSALMPVADYITAQGCSNAGNSPIVNYPSGDIIGKPSQPVSQDLSGSSPSPNSSKPLPSDVLTSQETTKSVSNPFSSSVASGTGTGISAVSQAAPVLNKSSGIAVTSSWILSALLVLLLSVILK